MGVQKFPRVMRDYLRKVNPRKDVLCSLSHAAWQQAATTRPFTSALQPCGAETRGEGILVCCIEPPSPSLFVGKSRGQGKLRPPCFTPPAARAPWAPSHTAPP